MIAKERPYTPGAPATGGWLALLSLHASLITVLAGSRRDFDPARHFTALAELIRAAFAGDSLEETLVRANRRHDAVDAFGEHGDKAQFVLNAFCLAVEVDLRRLGNTEAEVRATILEAVRGLAQLFGVVFPQSEDDTLSSCAQQAVSSLDALNAQNGILIAGPTLVREWIRKVKLPLAFSDVDLIGTGDLLEGIRDMVSPPAVKQLLDDLAVALTPLD